MAKFKWQGDKIKGQVEKQAEQTMYKTGQYTLDEANKIAPKDEGTLIQTSGVASDAESANVYYTQKYAPRLHEHPEYNFQNGRQGKWLEQTVLSNHDKLLQYMKNEMQKAFGGG